jgi:hypothetical protein
MPLLFRTIAGHGMAKSTTDCSLTALVRRLHGGPAFSAIVIVGVARER